MPVLGVGGVVELRRELPEPVLITPEARVGYVDALAVSTAGFWTGDTVWVWGPLGLPFDLNGDGEPDVTGGWGMFYGSKYTLQAARAARLTSGSAKWFGAEAPFKYELPEDALDRTELFIYRDSLDRLSFYRTLSDSLEADPEKRLTIYPVDFRVMLLAPAGSTGYQERLEPTYPEVSAYRGFDSRTELRLAEISTAAISEPEGDAADRPWRFVAEMDDWSLELDSQAIDTTGLGERFGDNTRALVTGGGQLNFFINRHEYAQEIDATFIARLLTVLEQGSKAEAKFKVAIASSAPRRQKLSDKRLPMTNVSYKASLLLTNTVTDVSAEDVIRGSARFVTVGRIRLDLS